jgi:predicted Zn-dependent protease
LSSGTRSRPRNAGGAPARSGRPAQRVASLILLILALGPLAVPADAQLPDTLGRPERSPLPEDVAQGLEIAMSLATSVGTVDTLDWVARLNDIGYRVASRSGDDSTPYSFAILDLDEPNALALPGGFIFVTRAMFEMGLSDDELAHLVGHEINHVRQRHFQRAARLDAIMSLARAAVTMGLLMSSHDRQLSTERAAVSEDPGLRSWSVGLTGSEALLQASALFGSVLQALFERGYSRGLELEADETGARLAARAGYDPEAGVTLLEKLHARSYEGRRYSYWRTHPYFDDRVRRARGRGANQRAATKVPDDSAYREHTALFFASSAQQVRDEDQAFFLYGRALACEPERLASHATALELARFKRTREANQPPLRRAYGSLIAAYDSLITVAERSDSTWSELAAARDERATLLRERDEEHPAYLKAIAQQDVPTEILEHFVENYPDDPQREEAAYELGVHQALTGKAPVAVERLLGLVAGGGAWADSARIGLLLAIPELKEMGPCCQLLQDSLRTGTDSLGVRIRIAARQRMDELVEADFSLEQGSRFLAACPDSPWSAKAREKLAVKADAAYRNGRVHEGLHQYQEALDSYYEVLAYAPKSSSATDAQAAIERIHRGTIED